MDEISHTFMQGTALLEALLLLTGVSVTCWGFPNTLVWMLLPLKWTLHGSTGVSPSGHLKYESSGQRFKKKQCRGQIHSKGGGQAGV